ncbi:MAG TPA: carboxymuconolactone decarboxylase family protein [Thermoanaerobaculia bacterium]|nr:carboxymuconolactone decarboxylase family protein [Thermoanaerobaculia bacterium]
MNTETGTQPGATAIQTFQVHTEETAPEAARPILEGARRSFGFVPNLLGVLANSPVALEAYTTLSQILERGTLSPAERQVVLLTVSVVNRCDYCVGAHTVIAVASGAPGEVIRAIREERAIAEPRLAALSTVARRLVERRGWLPEQEVQEFYDAGFEPGQLLEVVTALAMKTLSNFTNHLAETPLDGAFAEAAWTAPAGG